MDLASPNSIASLSIVFQIINLLVVLLVFICGIYGYILFVRLTKRGIRALDMYIERNKSDKSN